MYLCSSYLQTVWSLLHNGSQCWLYIKITLKASAIYPCQRPIPAQLKQSVNVNIGIFFLNLSGDFNVKPRLKHLLYTRIKNFSSWFICALFLPTLVKSKRTTCPTNNSNSLTSSILMTCPSISLQLLYTTLWIYHNFELPGIWLNKQEDFWIYGSSFQLVNSFLISHYAATGVWGACCNLAKSASLLSIPCPFWSGWSSVVGRSCDCLQCYQVSSPLVLCHTHKTSNYASDQICLLHCQA